MWLYTDFTPLDGHCEIPHNPLKNLNNPIGLPTKLINDTDHNIQSNISDDKFCCQEGTLSYKVRYIIF